MTITFEDLRSDLSGRDLPGGRILIEPHESTIADQALRADGPSSGLAHPLWFVIASLRGMGITVDELCAFAGQVEGDTLLFGSCEVTQGTSLAPGREYLTTARIGEVSTRTIRDGSRLDSVEVVVDLFHESSSVGTVRSVYLFKRAGLQ